MALKLGKLVQITWIDAHSDDGWQSFDEAVAKGTFTFYTVGWIMNEDERGIWLAQTWGVEEDEYQVGTLSFIPKGMILARQEF